MRAIHRPLITVLIYAFVLTHYASTQERSPEPASQPGGLRQLQEVTRELAREVDYLQEDIVGELAGQKERKLYRQADAVLAEVVQFQNALKPGVNRTDLSEKFAALDGKLHDLLEQVNALESGQRLLKRMAARVAAADERLHALLFSENPPDLQRKQVEVRQVRALGTAARQLSRTAEYALSDAPGHAPLLRHLENLVAATDAVQADLASSPDEKQLRERLAAVNTAWGRATRGLQDLRPAEHIHLLRIADRVDRLLGQLYSLFDMKGERARLLIRT